MKHAIHLEHRASSSQSKHEGEPSFGLCDRLDRTRVNSQRQLPTDHDYAVPTREYQTDQSSLKPAKAAARSVYGKKQKQRQRQKQPHRSSEVDTVTPYQALLCFDSAGIEQAAEPVIDGLLKILLAAEIALSREHGSVPKQELNLFDLFAGRMAQLCTGSAPMRGSA
jgi:hypothetical protein